MSSRVQRRWLRWIGVLVGVITFLGGSVPAAASTQDGTGTSLTEAQVVERARKLLDLPPAWGEPEVESNWGTYNLQWSVERPPLYAHAALDAATGQLIRFHRWVPRSRGVTGPSLSEEEAANARDRWLDRLVPGDIRSGLLSVPPVLERYEYGDGNFHFRWQRFVHGHPVRHNHLTLTIDGRTGELVDFQLAWTPAASFPLPLRRPTQEEARDLLAADIRLPLVYAPRYGDGSPGNLTWHLAYQVPQWDSEAVVGWDGAVRRMDGRPAAPETLTPLGPAPAWVPPPEPLSEAAAGALAQQAAGMTTPPTSVTEGSFGEAESPFWFVEWAGQGNGGVWVMVDVEGLVLEVSRNEDSMSEPVRPGEQMLSESAARERAVALVRRFRPDIAPNLALRERQQSFPAESGGPPSVVATFAMVVNGLPLDNLEVVVALDARDGSLIGFYSPFKAMFPSELPAPVASLTPQDALKGLLDSLALELTWVPLPGDQAEHTRMELVWALPETGERIQWIDAQTGDLLDHSGHPYHKARPPADIAGHPAVQALLWAWAWELVETDAAGNISPAQPMTGAEALGWLVRIDGRPYHAEEGLMEVDSPLLEALKDSPEAPYVADALQRGWVAPADLGEGETLASPVTRERFALWLARWLGYGRIAELPVALPLTATDGASVGAPYRGAVALLVALEILPLDSDGAVRPKAPLTRAEAATLLMRAAGDRHPRP